MYRSALKFLSNSYIKPVYTRYPPNIIENKSYTTSKLEIDPHSFENLYKKTKEKDYNYFFTKEFYKIKANNSELKANDICSKIADKWKTMQIEEKSKLSVEAQNARNKATEELDDLFKNFTLEEKNDYIYEVQKRKLEKRLEKIAKKSDLTMKDEETFEKLKKKLKKDSKLNLKSEWTKFGKPATPVIKNYWLEYLSSLDRGDATYKDFLRGAAAKWKQLPIQEQDNFKRLNRERMEQYKAVLVEWENRMFDLGHLHLLSPNAIKRLKQ